MTAIIHENSQLLRFLNWAQGNDFDGFTFGRRIFLLGEAKDDPELVDHERIHVHQYEEVGMVKFPLIYFYDYLKNRWNGMDDHDAYTNTRAEKEAYKYQDSYKRYMRRRQPKAWLHDNI